MPLLRWENGSPAWPDDTTYRDDHTYTFTRQGTCKPFGFRFDDISNSDNSGSWTVTIASVNPSGAATPNVAPTFIPQK